MSITRFQFAAFGLAASLVLTACMDGSASDTARPAAGAAGQVIERDVEAPEIFSKRENALWDGRPSLGGVWVAHPDVRAPERVIIRNTENGQETIGALFKRERMNPGPSIQVSADAASAIGMLAGAPTRLEIVALKVEEIRPAVQPVPQPDAPEPAPAEVAQTAPAAETPPAPAVAPVAASPAAQPAADETMIAMPEEASAPRRGLFGGLFGRRQPAAAQADAPIEIAALDDAPAPTAAPSGTPPMPAPSGAPQAPTQSQLDRPYIQLGIFSVEANANRARQMAAGAGLTARVVAGQSQGNKFWRVVVGPAATQAEQSQTLARVKGLGFNDAYAVRR